MGLIQMTNAESPIRQLGGRGVLRGVWSPASRRRRGPVALRPRLSPGVPCRGWIGYGAGRDGGCQGQGERADRDRHIREAKSD
jgi:hypothetical protein